MDKSKIAKTRHDFRGAILILLFIWKIAFIDLFDMTQESGLNTIFFKFKLLDSGTSLI